MINFAFQKVCMILLIVCSCYMMESVTLLEVDMPLNLNQDEIPSKLTIDKKYDRIPAAKIKQTQKPFANSHFTFFHETDNPNNEQNLMVQTFLKSSNNLFKSETDALDEKSTELGEIPDFFISKSRLQKIPIDCREITGTENGMKKIKRFSRAGKQLPFKKTDVVAPWIHTKQRRGKKSQPKYRISRSGCNSFSRISFDAKKHIQAKRNYHFLSTNQLHRRNRALSKTKFSTIGDSIKQYYLEETPPNPAETLAGMSDFNGNEKRNPSKIFAWIKSDKMKPRIKWIMKRQDDECWNRMRRIHCKKRITTKPKISVNDGKTAKIVFPLTHRCVKGTCPCSVRFEKCPPRTTCPPQPSVCIQSTLGRCQGVDRLVPTPPEDDMCPQGLIGATRSTRVKRVKSVKKRCACDCGCGCSSNLQPAHADHSDSRGRCNCGCGCGCAHGASGHCNVHDTMLPNT